MINTILQVVTSMIQSNVGNESPRLKPMLNESLFHDVCNGQIQIFVNFFIETTV